MPRAGTQGIQKTAVKMIMQNLDTVSNHFNQGVVREENRDNRALLSNNNIPPYWCQVKHILISCCYDALGGTYVCKTVQSS